MRAAALVRLLHEKLRWSTLACGLTGCLVLTAAIPANVSEPAGAQNSRPLSARDVASYQRIFALQREGQWQAADSVMADLDSGILLGHVLAQRYLHPDSYRSRYDELAGWLDHYADHPDAERIHRLALQRRPATAALPRSPDRSQTIAPAGAPEADREYRSQKDLTRDERREVRRLKARVTRDVRSFYLSRTAKLLGQQKVRRLLDQYELDGAYAELALGWFFHGDTDKARDLAGGAAERWGGRLPQAQWVAGLIAWQGGQYATAAQHFGLLAESENATSESRAAGAYWAARAHLASDDAAAARRWLAAAAEHARTFYGHLARYRLGLDQEVRFEALALTDSGLDKLLATPAGVRAVALVQVGLEDRAELELFALDDWNEPVTAQAMLALAHSYGLAKLGFEIGKRLLADGVGYSEETLDPVLYPVPPWRPADGFVIDRALIFAFIRQESFFNPRARSPTGARGVMQLMPRTAASLAGRRALKGADLEVLYDPNVNIALGQRYLGQLLGRQSPPNDLLRTAASYNAGPGNLRRWERRMDHDDDPLMFIESIPNKETRDFVASVLSNLWVYRLRFGQPTPSLDALAGGLWPTYVSLDAGTARFMSHQ